MREREAALRALLPHRERSRQPLHLHISFNAFLPPSLRREAAGQVRPEEGMLRASCSAVSGACFTVGSEKGMLALVAAHSNLYQRFR